MTPVAAVVTDEVEPTRQPFTYDQERQIERLSDWRLYNAEVRAAIRIAQVYDELLGVESEDLTRKGKYLNRFRFADWNRRSGSRLGATNVLLSVLEAHGVHHTLVRPVADRLLETYDQTQDETVPERLRNL